MKRITNTSRTNSTSNNFLDYSKSAWKVFATELTRNKIPFYVPRENKNNVYARFWRANKEYYGIFGSGQLTIKFSLNLNLKFRHFIKLARREKQRNVPRYRASCSPLVLSESE